MDPHKSEAWKAAALDLIFEALAASKTLEGKVAYKGARVLAKLLGGAYRQSYDIDLNLIQSFVDAYPDRNEQLRCLHDEIHIAMESFVNAQDPVRYQLKDVRISHRPKVSHPRGWDAFDGKIRLDDLAMAGVKGLPTLELDIAAPESLGLHSLAPIVVGHHEILAYTLERIAGEKLRAFLSTLPVYRAKVQKPGEAIRAKDIYDLARILQVRTIDNHTFWQLAGEEFRRACASRYIDCDGLVTFEEQLDVTRATYNSDAIIPREIAFDDAWGGLREVVRVLEQLRIIPFSFPLPE